MLISRLLKAWHPLTLVNLAFLFFLILAQLGLIITLMLIPSSVAPVVGNVLIVYPWVWLLAALFSLLLLFWNALRVNIRYHQLVDYTDTRNLVAVWAAPIIVMILMAVWLPLLEVVLDARTDWDFQRSRDEMLAVCDQVLAEGYGAAAIGDEQEIGVFNHAEVRLRRDGRVWIEIGEARGEIGYVCIPADGAPPEDTERYTFERKDDRFYFYEEDDDYSEPPRQRIFG